MRRTVLVIALLAVVAASGCLGGEARSEWAFEMTQLDAVSGTGRGVVIAILDTGVDVGHNALDHLVDGDLSDGELVGYRDFISGVEGVEAARDEDGHGTHVVGIISARGSSSWDKLSYGGVDLLGAAPDAQILMARVCDGDGCDSASLAPAVAWAVAHHADIISLSLGGRSLAGTLGIFQDAFTSAINDAIDRGVVVVASAGNDGPSNRDVSTPAVIPGVIAVGMVDRDGKVHESSSRGDDAGNRCTVVGPIKNGRCDPDKKPELVAPGVNILSTYAGGTYAKATGTSQAAPFVTATVALMLEGRPDLGSRSDVEHVKQVLVSTAKPAPGQQRPHDEAYGYGLLQAKAATTAYR